MDEQRRYLGGDSDHSILVKGLDFALLEQNKARLASTSSKQDDEALEELFAQKTSTLPAPTSTKRSRADIIKELKEKRVNGGESEQPKEEAVTEKPTNSSKFRPIGFKPIGAPTEEKIRKKRKKEGNESKKKKRKAEPSAGEESGLNVVATSPPPKHAASGSALTKPIEVEATEDDFDIFAGAGEYNGVEIGSDDDDDDDDNDEESGMGHERPSHPGPSVASTAGADASPRRGWFDNDAAKSEPEPESEVPPPKAPAEHPTPIPEAGVEAEEEQLARLAPLTSSAIPSIRDFLAMDEAVEKEEKRKARKEKRKAKK